MQNFASINKPKPPKVAVSNNAGGEKLNLLTASQPNAPKRTLKKILLFIVVAIIFLGSVALIRAANLSQKIFVGQKTSFFAKIVELIRGGGDNGRLIGEDLGQINVLLLGIGGQEHDGPYLTDTMILAQIRPDLGSVSLTSIPRDYLVDLPEGGGQDKINAAFTYGLLKNKEWDRGGSWARQVVQNISGIKIPYFAVVDFSGFEQAVDQVGGLDIYVERAFTDSSYPDKGTGYLPPINFNQGNERMDGPRALEFARSRHGNNNEGSDFARSVRQQKIIEAFKAKILSLNIIKDASTLNKLLSIFADHFHTNMSPAELLRVNNLMKGKNIEILSSSLDPETNLICPLILASNGAYVLTPCPGKSEDDVKNFFKNSFSLGKLTQEKSTVWLANSTANSAAYNTAFRKLTNAGLQVYQLSYSKDNLPQTLVYQVNDKPATAEFIKNEFNATEVNLVPPGVTASKDKVDIIIVLGQNAPIEAAPKPYIAPPARVNTSTPATSTPTSTTTNP